MHEAFGAPLGGGRPAEQPRVLGPSCSSAPCSDDRFSTFRTTPTKPNLPGSYLIDDEGVRGVRTELITDGVLTGRMHSRETAAEFGEPLSGNMRAVDAHFTPIVRMSNILHRAGGIDVRRDGRVDPTTATISSAPRAVRPRAIQFTFGAQWGYRIDNGKLGPMVRDINMSGELFSTLQAISMIGNDVKFGERGGCGKGGAGPMQTNRKSGKGAAAHQGRFRHPGRCVMHKLIEQAKGRVDQAELYWIRNHEITVTYENYRLQQINEERPIVGRFARHSGRPDGKRVRDHPGSGDATR